MLKLVSGTNKLKLTTPVTPRLVLSASSVNSTSGLAWGNITGTLSNQTDLQSALNLKQGLLSNSAGLASALSDETGSGYAVFSNSPTLTGTAGANEIQFDTTPTLSAVSQGKLYWDETDKTLAVDLDANTTLQIGQEQHVRVVNKTGVQLNDGQVVYISGAQGNRPRASLAQANSYTTSCVIGVVTENIADNGEGYVTVNGIVRGYNTSGFTDGDRLYLSPSTAGELTKTAPTSPNNVVVVATALNSTNNGSIYVHPHSPLSADGTLNDNTDSLAPTQKAVKTYADTKQTGSTNLTSLSGLAYASASFVKMTGANTFTLDTNTYLTGNQSITLGGVLSGSGTTSITVSAASGYYMPTTTDQTTWNGKQTAYIILSTLGALSNSSGWLKNDGAGVLSYSTPSKSDVGLSNVENTALSTWAGTTNLTTAGILTATSLRIATEPSASTAIISMGTTPSIPSSGAYISINQPTGGTADFINFRKNGTSKFYASSDGIVSIAGDYITPYGLYNSTTANNAYFQTPTTGAKITRNVADANPALIVQQVHASSTGDILQLKNDATTVETHTRTGTMSLTGADTGGLTDLTINPTAKVSGNLLRLAINNSDALSVDVSSNMVLNYGGAQNGGKLTQYAKSATDAQFDVFNAVLDRGSGVGGVGLGLGYLFTMENGAGNRKDAGRFIYAWGIPTAGSESAYFSVQAVTNGTMSEAFRLYNGNATIAGSTTTTSIYTPLLSYSASSGTDQDGQMVTIAPGASTGTGKASVRLQRDLRASSTGSTANSKTDALIITSEKTLTDATDISLFEVALPTLTGCGGHIDYTVTVTDGTDIQVHSGHVNYAAVNKGGTYTTNIVDEAVTDQADARSSGTLSESWSILTGTNKITIRCNFDSSLTPTSMKIYYTIHNGSAQTITQL